MKCSNCGRDFSGEECPFCKNNKSEDLINNINLPVLKDKTSKKRKKTEKNEKSEKIEGTEATESDGKRKNVKMVKIIIIAVIVILIIAAVVAAAVRISGKKDKSVNDSGTHTEEAGDESLPQEEYDTTPVTFNEDVSLSFEGISLDYETALDDYAAQSASTTAAKGGETPASTSRASVGTVAQSTAPKKNQITPGQHLEATTVKTGTPSAPSDKATKVIAAFFDGQYYFDGEMISPDGKMPFEIAMKGSDYQVFTEISGSDVCIMNKGGKLYLMNPSNKKYAELNAAIKKMMGITDDMSTFEFTKVKFNADSPTSVTSATYKGKSAICYEYRDSSTRLEFIAVNGDVKQMIMYGSSGSADTILDADEFTAEIPDEMFNFKGYSKTNILSFVSSLM